ncbi:MAG: hypothetical protein A2X35_03570 [Elusimicrobia bacterium GWA2_61_42]|nr:MAG: hypothetical protein A2X35_03570 [Elusimicrobia bacterium GWA2_61_42]OGR77660.1 MAG: hypothetical protein A2X38_09810 [Elusimicrobia bacterium GWC2_61_25]
MSYYKRLKNDLAQAAAKGLITPEQAAGTWDSAYASRPLASFKAVHWIAAAAGLFIALGFILVAAHNWDKIGAIAKMCAYLLLFAGTAAAALRLQDKPAAAPLEILWFFMPALGIGLYAQIFNLSGDPVKPYLAWAAISAPLAAFSKRPLAAYLVSFLLFAVLFWGTLGSSNMLALTANYGRAAQPLWHWPLALVVLAGGAALYPGQKLGAPLGAAAVWTFFMLAADTAIKVRSEALVLLAGMSLAVLWLSWGRRPDSEKAGLPLTVWTASVYAMTFFWHYKPHAYHGLRGTDTVYGAALTWIIFAGALLTALFRPQRLLPEGREEDLVAKGLLAASVLCAFFLFGATEVHAKALAVTANFILAAFGVGCIMSGARNSDEKLINRGVLVITLTAVTRFVDIFGGLLKSGVAFIITGLAFAALAYFVNRGRKALIESVKK